MKLILVSRPEPFSVYYGQGILTINKIYDGELTPTMYDPNTLQPVDPSYVVRCNDGKMRKFDSKHFITVEEWREQQLDKILLGL